MLPLFNENPESAAELATAELAKYEEIFEKAWTAQKRRKLGLVAERPEDATLFDQLLDMMQQSQTDFSLFFRQLSESNPQACRDNFIDRDRFDDWSRRYAKRLSQESRSETERRASMQKINPKYVLRNYIAENAIRMAEDEQDYTEIDRLISLLSSPFDPQPGMEYYAQRPPGWANTLSVSCSS